MESNQKSAVEKISEEKDVFVKAKLIQKILRDEGIRIKDLSRQLNLKPSYICHLLRLLRIPAMIIDGYLASNISLSHLFVLSRLKDKQQMIAAYEKVLSESLTVAKTEELVRDILYRIKTKGDYLPQEVRERLIEKIVGSYKNISLKIIQTRIKAKLILEIRGSLDDTGRLLELFLKSMEGWQSGK